MARAAAGQALVLPRHVPLQRGAARPLPRALAVRRRGDRVGRSRRRRRGDRAAGSVVPRAAASSSCDSSSTRSAMPNCRPAYRELLRRLPRRARSTSSTTSARERRDTNPMRVLDSKDAARPGDHHGRAAHHRSPVRGRAPPTSPRCARYLDARGVAYDVDARARARPRLLHAHGLGVEPGAGARRPRSRAAAATTGWPSRSAARRTPGVGLRLRASSGLLAARGAAGARRRRAGRRVLSPCSPRARAAAVCTRCWTSGARRASPRRPISPAAA